jgi:hypothetical protein
VVLSCVLKADGNTRIVYVDPKDAHAEKEQ